MEFPDCSLGFRVSYINQDVEEQAANNCNHTFSKLLNVVFIRRACLCPFSFQTKVEPPPGSYVRAVCVMRNSGVPLQRCSRHMKQDYHISELASDCSVFMRCHDVNAVYENTQEGHTSIVFPVGPYIQEGSILSGKVESFEFLCSNYCVGERQKSPLMFILTLENDYVVLSRQSININVCASPGRDKRNWEKAYTARKNSPSSTSSYQSAKKSKSCIDDEIGSGSAVSTSSSEPSIPGRSQEHDSMDDRIRQGLEALDAIPKHVVEYYKQLRKQRLDDSNPSSWPVCTSCYRPLDIDFSDLAVQQSGETVSSSSTASDAITSRSVRYSLRRSVYSLSCKVRYR